MPCMCISNNLTLLLRLISNYDFPGKCNIILDVSLKNKYLQYSLLTRNRDRHCGQKSVGQQLQHKHLKR